MPLDGLRAWIGEVERKLGMRTRVFLVLTALAIGGAGAAIYLAIDTREDAVSESDVRELQQRLEAQIAGEEASAPETRPEAAEPPATLPEPETAPKPQGPGTGSNSDTDANPDGGEDTGVPGGLDDEEAKAKLRDFLEQAKEEAGED